MAEPAIIKLAVMALGGQGGGVLANWIVSAFERAGYLAQSTSVPGVAQRTGATIYYIEAFPEAAAAAAGREPVLALSPAEGDVDIVLASELMEAVRAVDRGFVTRDQTTLIASTHRVYTIGEKSAMGDGILSSEAALAKARDAARRCLAFDMEAAADDTGAAISAVLFGALAGSGATGIAYDVFEAVIRADGRMVEVNLAGFARGWELAAPYVAEAAESEGADGAPTNPPTKFQPGAARIRARISQEFPEPVRETALAGADRAADYQNLRYASLYLDRLKAIREADALAGGAAREYLLTEETARHLALWMCYEDAVRVADLKTRGGRFARIRDEARAAPGQIVHVSEYMHPRPREICDILPAPLGGFLLKFRPAHGLLSVIFSRGRRVSTSKLRGFLQLYLLAGLRPLRPLSLRYAEEGARIAAWLRRIAEAAHGNYDLGVEIARCQRLIKGYGDTHARGLKNFARVMGALEGFADAPDAAERLARLRDAALADEDGAALSKALGEGDAEAA